MRIKGDEFLKPWIRIEDVKDLDLPRPIVLVNGVFDLLHSGHMFLLSQAALAKRVRVNRKGRPKQGTVVCAVDSDRLVQRNKGLSRPILKLVERMNALNYMPVDYLVEIDSDEEFQKLYKSLKPDIRVRNLEYKGKTSRIEHTGKTVWVPVLSTISTTEIIKKCREA